MCKGRSRQGEKVWMEDGRLREERVMVRMGLLNEKMSESVKVRVA